jgi:hypothetical protein
LYDGLGNLIQATDHYGGVIRNNMCTLSSGLFSPARTADSDGQILVWQSPDTEVLHNNILTNGQIDSAVQFRWNTAGASARNNLFDDGIRTRDGGTFATSSNTFTAQPSWFVNAPQGNLRLSGSGSSNTPTASRQNNCLDDIDGAIRAATTKVGAHIYV